MEILIINKTESERKTLELIINNILNYNCFSVYTIAQALDHILWQKTPYPTIIIVDIESNDITNNVEIIKDIKTIKKIAPYIFIIAISKDINISTIDIMRESITEFIAKPIEIDRLEYAIKNCLNKQNIEQSALHKFDSKFSFDDFAGTSASREYVATQAYIAAKSNRPILICGEYGTGKSMLAYIIHDISERKNNIFRLNLPISYKILKNKLEKNEGGTLIAELPHTQEMPPKEWGNIQKMAIIYNVKLIILSQNPKNGHIKNAKRFGDMVPSMHPHFIHIPPLDERIEDIIPITERFLQKISEKQNFPKISLSKDAINYLHNNAWIGNILQLQWELYNACIKSRDDNSNIITKNILLNSFIEKTELNEISINNYPQITINTPAKFTKNNINKSQSFDLSNGYVYLFNNIGTLRNLQDIENDVIDFALKYCRESRAEIAQALGIGRTTLYRKSQEIKIKQDPKISF